MKLPDVLEELFRQNITLQIRNEHVHCDPPGAVPADIEPHLRRYETTIAAYMRGVDGNSRPFYPLSSAQKTIWFLDQLAPHPTSYKIRFEARLLSKINVPAIKTALQLLIDRHPALRTTYASLDGEPVQQIHDYQEVSFEVIASSEWPRERLNAVMRDIKQRPMDLAAGPLLHAYLFALPKGKHLFWLFLHHITVDFLSLEMLIDEFGRLYSCLSRGRSIDECRSELPAPDQTYLDYMRWKLNMLAGDEGAAHLAYLRQLLRDQNPVLELPTDRPRPPAQTFTTSACFFSLGSDLTRRIKNFVRTERTALYPLLASALFVLLQRYTGQDDLLIGAPRSEQGHKTFKNIVGLFDNPVPLRANLAGNPSFRSVLRTIHNLVWETFDHEDYPSHLLPTQLHLQRDASHPPLFQVLLALHEERQRKEMSAFLLGQGGERLEVGDLLMQSVGLDEHLAIFVDLQLRVFEEYGGLTVLWQYNTDLFDASTIERMGEHFQVLLTGIVENPETPLAELPLMTEAERHKILVEWNDTQVDYPQDRCIHELFEEQVRKTPEAIAVVGPTINPEHHAQTDNLQYQELNCRANQLAHYLRKLGVGPDVLVGICMERSLEMIVGLLAILKAGGAYVPLDPAYPQERLAFLLDDAQVSVLVTEQKLLSKLPMHHPHILCLDSKNPVYSQESIENGESAFSIQNLAYMIYTSGSTGKPKGVLIPYTGLLNLVYWHQQRFGITAADRATQLAGNAFDASVWEIWPYLTAGATLFLVENNILASSKDLQSCMLRNAITISFVPTPLAEELLSLEWPADTPLRMMLTGGDVLHDYLPESIPFTLINNYGPTESSVVATSGKVSARKDKKGRPSIGRPIANTKVYIFDRYAQPVAPGIPGEIYIGGAGLARGYWNRPQLTQQSFIPNPFTNTPGDLLYRTGDRARYLPNGTIKFLGRIDHQVKIRGFRIELGEVEAILKAYRGIKESIVIVREDRPNERKLVAYIVPGSEKHDTTAEYRIDETQGGHVSQWQNLYDTTYTQDASLADPTFNVIGWNSSYTGKPIPQNAMREWVDTTVAGILALHPQRVLEIGCGTGLLLFRIAPHCEQYWGTDFSQVAIDHVWQQVAHMHLPQVQLLHTTADDFEGIPAATFDVLILNSVSQHFPNIDYFLHVLAGMVQSAAPGGVIFIGDVRSLPLLELFHTSVQLYQAPDTLSVEQLQQRIQTRMTRENELVIAPEFFLALQQRFLRISNVRILPKRGTFQNELTRFRYDVILFIDTHYAVTSPPYPPLQEARGVERMSFRRSPLRLERGIEGVKCMTSVIETNPQNMPDIRWLDWQTHALNAERLRAMLAEEHPAYLGVTGIPNSRLRTERAAADALRRKPDIRTVAELRAQIEQYSGEPGIDPEALWRLGENHLTSQPPLLKKEGVNALPPDPSPKGRGEFLPPLSFQERGAGGEFSYRVELSWAQGHSDGAFDALFVRRAAETPDEEPVRFPTSDRPATPLEPSWNAYANNPTQAVMERQLIPHLRAYVQERLPEYMVPAAFVLLDKLPLTPNGKVNRQALPAPERTRPELATAYVSPRSELEETLVRVWQELLDLEQIGVFDDFFELGGDSLTVTRLIAHIRSLFDIELPITGLFEGHTIAGLAETIETMLMAEIDALSEEDAQRLLAQETDGD